MQSIATRIPARLDRLPWSPFHLAVVLALGVTWVLDGLEVTLIGAMGGVLQEPGTLHLSAAEIGAIGSAYVVGAVAGGLVFGYLTDRHGRRLIFFTTLGVYLTGVLLSAVSWDVWSFAAFRLLTGLGIGGEYSAINSAIDELIPARLRGRVDLAVNGSFWLGAAMGSGATVILLDTDLLGIDVGWRLGFAIGGVLGLFVLLLRRHLPESPRWLASHGRVDEAEVVVTDIERTVTAHIGRPLPPPEGITRIVPRRVFGFGMILSGVLARYRRRGLLCFVLMVTQAFLYNSVLFSYGLVLVRFYGIPGADTGTYLLPLAAGNFLGPLILGPLFDAWGRRVMIAGTYAASGLLLALTGWMFARGMLTDVTMTAAWSAVFFFASAAASSAYLTVSEVFPLETRALAIAFFYALGTGVGGTAAPWLFGRLIDAGQRLDLLWGYLMAAALMLIAALTEAIIGVDAENKPLEQIAEPLARDPDMP